MLRLLERNIASIEKKLVLVAPSHASLAKSFNNIRADGGRHQDLLQEMQRLRGSIYLQDGALQPHQLTNDGLHQTPEDDKSWHLLMLNAKGNVSACAWYMEHDEAARFEHLRVRNCGLARIEGWREKLSRAVESELQRARENGLRYAEVGGWAVAKESRCTSEGLLLALAASQPRSYARRRARSDHRHRQALLFDDPEAPGRVPSRGGWVARPVILRSEVQVRDGTASFRLPATQCKIRRSDRTPWQQARECDGHRLRGPGGRSGRARSCQWSERHTLRRLRPYAIPFLERHLQMSPPSLSCRGGWTCLHATQEGCSLISHGPTFRCA